MVQIESKGEQSFIHGIAELEGCRCYFWGENLLLVEDKDNGRYFADEDGFGMEDNDEVQVYCVMNDNLEVVKPFGPGK